MERKKEKKTKERNKQTNKEKREKTSKSAIWRLACANEEDTAVARRSHHRSLAT